MKYLLHIPKAYRPDGRRIVHAGNWRVPDDLSEEIAERAMKEAGAVKVNTVIGGAPETKDPSVSGRPSRDSGQAKPSPSSDQDLVSTEEEPKRRRGRPPGSSRST
jgi:hypothetical protein